MITIKKSITIQASHLAVFKVITDFQCYSKWNPWVTCVHGRCEQDGLVTSTRIVRGFSINAQHRITELNFPEKMRWVSTGWYRSLVNVERERLVFPCADGSTLYTVKLLLSGPLAQIASWLVRRSLRDGMRAETLALKQWCEAQLQQPQQAVKPRAAVKKMRSVDMSGEHQVDLALR